MNPLRFAYDPDGALQTWKGIADLSSAVTNPASLASMAESNPQGFESMLKGLARTDEWSKDRPMLGATQNILDVLTLPFAAGKAGEAGEIASAAGRVSETLDAGGGSAGVYRALDQAGEAGRAGSVPGNISKETPQITRSLEDIAGKPVTVEPPAGGRPVPAGHSPGASPSPDVKPVPDVPAAPRSAPGEGPRAVPAQTHDAPIPVEHESAHSPNAPATAASRAPFESGLSGGSVAESPPGAGTHPAGASQSGVQTPVAHHHVPTSADGHAPLAGTESNGGHGAADHQREGGGHDDSAAGNGNASADGAARHSPISDESRGEELNEQQRDDILAMDKGSRPDPADYLSPEYVERHLERFDEGATRFMTADNLEAFGIGQRDGTTFVFPRSELDSLMESTGGDRSRLEQALGLPDGYFSTYEVVRVDIPDPRSYDLRMPSGNEAGANDKWIPGGFLPEGMPEAVIDGAEVPSDGLIVTDLSKPSD